MMQKLLLILSTLFMVVVGMVPIGTTRLTPAVRVEGADPGLFFGGRSLAYTDRFTELSAAADELTISLHVSPVFLDEPEFGTILGLYDEKEKTRITVGQWDRTLMILEGSDFSNSRREPKMYIPIPSEEKLEIHIISNQLGTTVFFNGKQEGFNPSLFLPLPANPDESHLTVGNSTFVWDAWTGTIHSLEIYDRSVIPDNGGTRPPPILEYRFDGQDGDIVNDLSGHGLDLHIAERLIQLDREFLRIPSLESLYRDGMQRDIIINFFGFMPFGFLLYLVGRKRFEGRRLPGILAVLAWSFFFSLGIESLQVLLPARDSSLLDLILNTIGGMSAAVAASLLPRRA